MTIPPGNEASPFNQEPISISEGSEATPPNVPDSRRGFVRRVIYPIAVIAAIIGIIWWLDFRSGGAKNPMLVKSD